MGKLDYESLKQMGPEQRQELLQMLDLSACFAGDLFPGVRANLERIKREEDANKAAETFALAEAKTKEDAEMYAKAVAEVAAREAAEAATKVLAEQAEEREHREQARLKAEADARIQKQQEEMTRQLLEKDKIIEEYKKAVEEYKNALFEKQNAVDLQHLSMEYMHFAKQNQYLLNLIKNLSNPLDPILIRSTIVGDIESAKAAIRLGADVNAQDMQLDTPLHKACSSNDMQMVRFLLANCCDISKINIAGKTASELTSNSEIAKSIADYQRPKLDSVTSQLNHTPTVFAKPRFDNTINNEIENKYQHPMI